MIVTASKIPVPEPMAPRKSAITDKPPIHSPPKAAAVGMYLEHKTEIERNMNQRTCPIPKCQINKYIHVVTELVISWNSSRRPEINSLKVLTLRTLLIVSKYTVVNS